MGDGKPDSFSLKACGREYETVSHLCYVLEADGKKVLILGDSDYDSVFFKQMAGAMEFDAVIANPLFLHLPRGRRVFTQSIRTKEIIFCHLPFAEDDQIHFRNMMSEDMRQYETILPPMKRLRIRFKSEHLVCQEDIIVGQNILIEISARHIHLSKEHLEILFGEGYELTVKKMLSQPGQFACEERVSVIGPKGKFSMSVLGPVRERTQVEISLTDARTIGVSAPIRESGDVEGSGSCVLEGPRGTVILKEGVIAAKRHIHTTPEDAKRLGVTDRETVAFEVNINDRSLIFKDMVVRVSEHYSTAAHIDTDEANAGGHVGTVYGTIVKLRGNGLADSGLTDSDLADSSIA